MGNKDSDQARQWLRLSLVFAGRIGHFFCFVMVQMKLSHFVYFTKFRYDELIFCGESE